MDERTRILDHLENDYTEPIRDPVWKHIYVSPGLLKIIEHPRFQKLTRIRQLGPASLVYPGATHTRFCHSLGVFHLSRRMIVSLARHGKGREGSGIGLTLDGVKAFLCAALLHDIGHYPFAHSLKDLNVEAHEVLTGRLILGEMSGVIRAGLGIEPEMVAAIVDGNIDIRGIETIGIYRKILSGALDPDKLDYLNRDAFFCGVPYGIQDLDFILDDIFPNPEMGISISGKGVTALENALFSKYLMYKTIYWHKTVRIATAMIKKAICMGLTAGAIRREDLYGLDDGEFFSGFGPSRFPGFSLISDVGRRELHKQVYRIPFHDEWPSHCALEDVMTRLDVERRIAGEAGAVLGRRVPEEDVVIDVPERISFDIDIAVRGGEEGVALCPRITRPASLFSDRGEEDFPRSLRCISVAVRRNPDLLSMLAGYDFSAIMGAS
jgi:hypothetical protein